MPDDQVLPVKFLEGKKVFLRPYSREDADFVYRMTFGVEGRRLTGTRRVFTRSTIENFLDKISGDESRVDLVICEQATGQPVGEVVINDIDFFNRSANIRIGIFDEKFQGKGYGSEAMALMLNHGFGILNLHRISLGVFTFNDRAIHVYEKLGFKREGALREALYYNHRYHDEIIMSILKDEFQPLE